MIGTGDAHVLNAAGPQTIREVAATHALLLAALRDHGDVKLDCSDTTDSDLCFVQLLLAASASARIAGRRFALREPPCGRLAETLVRGGFVAAGPAPVPSDPALWRISGAGA